MAMDAEGSPKIRIFRQEDLPQIMDIENQAFPKTAYPKEFLLHYARRLPEGFVVIEKGSNILGYMIFDRGGHVYSTAVKVSHRRRGIGTLLFTHASQHARERLWLEVRSKNDGALAFYGKMGMKVVGRVPDYYTTDDALIMAAVESATDAGTME
jgi:ribosomal-protein-alanine N-acetyltransferase